MQTDKLNKLIMLLFILGFTMVTLVVGVTVPLAALLGYVVISFLIAFRLNFRGFGIFLFVLSFAIRLAFTLAVNTPPISDFSVLFEAAKSFAQGDFSFHELPYFREWAYQTGFVVYQGLLVKLFGPDSGYLALKILNVFYASCSCLFVYVILKNQCSEKVARFTSLLCTGLVFHITFVTVLSNQPVSTFFLLAGLVVVTVKSPLHGITKYILAGFLIGIGNILRPEGVILIGAMIIVSLLRLLKPEKERRYIIIASALSMIFVYFSTNALASQLIIARGVHPDGLKNNNVLWKFVAGLNSDSRGSYSDEDSNKVFYSSKSIEERDALQLKMIGERLGVGPKKLISLFTNKQNFLWSGDPIWWSFRHLENSKKTINLLGIDVNMNDVARRAGQCHSMQILLLIVLSILGALRFMKEPFPTAYLIFYLILLLSAGIYLFIEVQPRYIFFSAYILAITSGFGLEWVSKWALNKCM